MAINLKVFEIFELVHDTPPKMLKNGEAASCKRRKTTETIVDGQHINDLPVGFLVDVAAYLSKPSRAIFAVAMSARSSYNDGKHHEPSDLYWLNHQPSDTSKAIISSTDWETLDFVDIQKSLAKRISDDDLCAILRCINAKQTLEKLKLTGLVNIEGHGLEPIRGSSVLELIDLSLVGKYEDRNISPVPKIGFVVPILYSLFPHGIKYIHFPACWRRDEAVTQCKVDYSVALRRRRYNCSSCGLSLERRNDIVLPSLFVTRICYDCLNSFCGVCDEVRMYLCNICKKHYCSACNQFSECRSCGESVCSGCKLTCYECENDYCQQYCKNDCDCYRMREMLGIHW